MTITAEQQILTLLAERAGEDVQRIVESARAIELTANRSTARLFLNLCEQTVARIRDEHFPEETPA